MFEGECCSGMSFDFAGSQIRSGTGTRHTRLFGDCRLHAESSFPLYAGESTRPAGALGLAGVARTGASGPVHGARDFLVLDGLRKPAAGDELSRRRFSFEIVKLTRRTTSANSYALLLATRCSSGNFGVQSRRKIVFPFSESAYGPQGSLQKKRSVYLGAMASLGVSTDIFAAAIQNCPSSPSCDGTAAEVPRRPKSMVLLWGKIKIFCTI